jgi:hypothetical protein
MRARVLVRAVASLLIACSGAADTVEAPLAGAERVFVEAALAKLDSDELALVRSSDLERIIMGNSPDVISTVGGLAEQGVPLVFDPGAYAKAHAADAAEVAVALDRLEVTPALTRRQAVQLDMALKLSAEGRQYSFTKVDVFSGSHLLVWDTDLKTRSGESIVLLVQPTVIESERELTEILARRTAGTRPTNP